MGGLHPSDLVVLAGRPGMGKTSLATKVAFGAAKALLAEARANDPNALAKQSSACSSWRWSAAVGNALVSEKSMVSSDRIRRGDISQRDFDKFVQVSREIRSTADRDRQRQAITCRLARARAG